MIHNDVLRSLRYTLNVSDAKMVEIAALGGATVTESEMKSYLLREEEPGFLNCSDEIMARFLNGLVIFKRGVDPSRPAQALVTPVTNNIVLKKIRAAFELKEEGLRAIIEKSGLKLSKTELNALFRSVEHRNYRECGDQFLRNFLKGLGSSLE